MRIVIELKKDANPQVVLNKLFSYTQLQDTVGVIMLALVNGIPKVLTLKEMLEQYIDFQVDVITRRTKFDLNKAKEREHILKGLVIALDNIDEVIEIMKTSKNIPEAKQRLNQRFGLTDIQADHIMERQKIIDELAEIEVKIADLEDILAKNQQNSATACHTMPCYLQVCRQLSFPAFQTGVFCKRLSLRCRVRQLLF